jgi:hypothetical protein
MKKRFTWIFTPVYESTTAYIEDGAPCADVFIYNNPTSVTALINGCIQLPPGSTLSLPAFSDERQDGTLIIEFSGGNGSAIIARKRYK